MTILYISSSAKVGGAEASLLELVAKLDRRRYTPLVLCPEGGRLEEVFRAMGVETFRYALRPLRRGDNPLRQAGNFFRLLASSPHLARRIRDRRVDLVHTNGARAQVYGAPAAALARVPLLWHVRDAVPMGVLERALQRWSAVVVAPSRAVEASIAASARVVRVFNGIDVEGFRARARREKEAAASSVRDEFGVRNAGALVVMIGQIVAWKGHDAFLRATAAAVRSIPTARFVVVGGDLSGGNRGYLAGLEELRRSLGLEATVSLVGHRDDVARILAAADVLVLPSRGEPFGRVLLEAMALEKPVVAFNDGGPAEIVVDGETGFLVPPGDVDRLAGRIVEVVQNPELGSRLGRRGRELALEVFNADRHAAAVQDIYDGMARHQVASFGLENMR